MGDIVSRLAGKGHVRAVTLALSRHFCHSAYALIQSDIAIFIAFFFNKAWWEQPHITVIVSRPTFFLNKVAIS